MIKKFLEGFVFGAGFSLAFVVVALFAGSQVVPSLLHVSGPSIASETREFPSISSMNQKSGPKFYDLPVEEQIKQASVIALVRYEPAPDGKMKAILREFLKNAPNTIIHYKVGDEFPSASFYPKEREDRGDGVVVFFDGSPAEMRLSMSYSGDRIRGLADIPIELFRKKCAS